MTDWKTDGWKYRGELGGVHDTRHGAIGAAAIAARKQTESRRPQAPDGTYIGPDPLSVLKRVYAFKPFRCGYCSETFLTKAEHDEHQPCPHYEPTEGRQHSNPIEAARMTRYNL